MLHETIAVQTAATLSCRDFNLPVFDCPYHRHPEFEILRINESRGRVLAGDFAGIFEPGKIYLSTWKAQAGRARVVCSSIPQG
ncbi:MAG: hypothetical protein EBS54_10215 [Betaproteobacteria bacterium]|nr:hypothetical protein [Betaproteobacteria bacterium]